VPERLLQRVIALANHLSLRLFDCPTGEKRPMEDWGQTINTALGAGAAAWPLAAGLTIVLWSKARARQAQAAAAKVRVRR
jgi:hypothetical protein